MVQLRAGRVALQSGPFSFKKTWQQTVAELKAMLSGLESRSNEGKGKRFRKGEAERIIVELLKHKNFGRERASVCSISKRFVTDASPALLKNN